jgi:hypothetical protein
VPQLQADYVRSLSGAEDGLTVRFAAAPDHAFALPFANGDTSWAEIRGGMKGDQRPPPVRHRDREQPRPVGIKDDRAIADFTFRF